MYLGAGPAFPLVLHISLVFSAGEPKDVFSAAFALPFTDIFSLRVCQLHVKLMFYHGEENILLCHHAE